MKQLYPFISLSDITKHYVTKPPWHSGKQVCIKHISCWILVTVVHACSR